MLLFYWNGHLPTMPSTAHKYSHTLSVVIPCFNDAELLKSCLHSLTKQTVPADEIVVVNNGSTDHSAAVAQSFEAFKVRLVNEPRNGITWANAAGFNAATSDVILRIDADVTVDPTFIQRVHEIWEQADLSHQAGERIVVGISGSGRFGVPGVKGKLISQLYLGLYRSLVGSALGHYPLFGSNSSIRKQWWDEVHHTLDLSDTFVHEDMQLSFAVRPHETIWLQKDLVLTMDDRALRGSIQLLNRLRRGFHTIIVAWKIQLPHQRLGQRGLLGSRLAQVVREEGVDKHAFKAF
ncbi:glycosyltransferase family 2 protein [Corynebacterium callunae]|uniref:glycosyltransferase family 2 protein n=1 Tax=Corynebacterium callunae TaxID=1721 RepID=UPI001FFFECB5|nr:glycosyltransferase family 2 protein [Corynebacterium callunae]MCK2200883.1 glycosyltransferase [Corynebacterium callunae]